MKILVASNNLNKIAEFRQILNPLGFSVVSLGSVGIVSDPVETGKTYRENALFKAECASELRDAKHPVQNVENSEYDYPIVADDSGFEVAALGGFPGLYSARFAHTFPDDFVGARNCVVKMLEHTGDRRASFHCSICLLVNGKAPMFFDGDCQGTVLECPDGSHFGYDPIFESDENHVRFGVASQEEKNAVSHRGKALRQLADYVSDLRKKGEI